MLPLLLFFAASWQPLFDGRTLTGWVNEGGANFRVENGAIVVDQGPYSWLRTERVFTDYELRLEYLTAADGNSGVFLRSAAQGRPHETGYELQIFDDRKDFKTGSLLGVIEAKPNRIRPNVWNKVEVRHIGPRIIVKMNGRTVVDTTDTRTAKGHLGLQFNPNKPIRFRNLRVREL